MGKSSSSSSSSKPSPTSPTSPSKSKSGKSGKSTGGGKKITFTKNKEKHEKQEKQEKKDKKEKKEKQEVVATEAAATAAATAAAATEATVFDVAYYQGMLDEIREKCEKKLHIKTSQKDAFVESCAYFNEAYWARYETDEWLAGLQKNPKSSKKETQEAIDALAECNKQQAKDMRSCIKAAIKIFDKINEEKLESLEKRLLKGCIISLSTPQELAKFAANKENDNDKDNDNVNGNGNGNKNAKLMERLFGDFELMKEMVRHGGPVKNQFTKAIQIYAACVDDKESEWGESFQKINKKIALAVALELASPLKQFDTAFEIDPVQRFEHYEKAHRLGELDPAFPHFSVWELRHVVNCDAKHEQMKWCRDMVMNYVPYLTTITDEKLKYLYILDTDVRVRPPTWTSSPRTYQQVLSGGGKDSPNAWFGRFILKSFGLPCWGTKQPGKIALTRWTPNGWEPMKGANWETCEWQGVTGIDFKNEVEARNKAPPEEWFKKLVVLECLADVMDGNPNEVAEEERNVIHGDRLWKALAIISKALLLGMEAEVVRTFERNGEGDGQGQGLVKTNVEKYLTAYEIDAPDAPMKVVVDDDNGSVVVTIPASHHGFSSGNTMVIESWAGGKQLNFLADGIVEYEVPEDAPTKSYTLTCEVCTVHLKQAPLTVQVGDATEVEEAMRIHNMEMPYTIGEWQESKGVNIEVGGGTILRFSRPKGAYGLAIRKFTLS